MFFAHYMTIYLSRLVSFVCSICSRDNRLDYTSTRATKQCSWKRLIKGRRSIDGLCELPTTFNSRIPRTPYSLGPTLNHLMVNYQKLQNRLRTRTQTKWLHFYSSIKNDFAFSRSVMKRWWCFDLICRNNFSDLTVLSLIKVFKLMLIGQFYPPMRNRAQSINLKTGLLCITLNITWHSSHNKAPENLFLGN